MLPPSGKTISRLAKPEAGPAHNEKWKGRAGITAHRHSWLDRCANCLLTFSWARTAPAFTLSKTPTHPVSADKVHMYCCITNNNSSSEINLCPSKVRDMKSHSRSWNTWETEREISYNRNWQRTTQECLLAFSRKQIHLALECGQNLQLNIL